jgi:hypothetical protein
LLTKIARGGDRPGVCYYKCEFFSIRHCLFTIPFHLNPRPHRFFCSSYLVFFCIFYEFKSGGCKFFQWKEVYGRTLQEYGGQAGAQMVPAVVGHANHAAGPNQQDLGRINLFVPLINTAGIMIVLAILLAASAATFNK